VSCARAEKVSRAKFTGLTSGEPELGTFMALESLCLGVDGKASMWKALEAMPHQLRPERPKDSQRTG